MASNKRKSARPRPIDDEEDPDEPVQVLPKKRPKFQYSEENMQSALKAVREGKMTSRKASREYGVPFSTLQYKVKGKAPEIRKMGPPTILSTEEEDLLSRYIVANAKKGFPLNKRTLIETVQNIVTEDNRPNPFTNNKPGYSWISGFLKRHPGLTQCHAETINRGRAQITEAKLRGWAQELKVFLKEEKAEDILNEPERIFNLDESGFRTNPESGLVLGPVNYKNFYIVKDGSEKESITTLVTVNAAGEMLPPMIVFPYVRIPMEIARNCNPEWALGRSPSGWMTGQTFFCFIGNTFIPWIKSHKIKLPVLLLIDGHKSHLTLNVCRLCQANGIILYALLPNATHIIQPLDVSVFRSLKAGWTIVVEDWKRNSDNKVLTRAKFPRLFEKVLNERATSKIIQNGFKKCGLYPFNPDSIDFTKCLSDLSRTSETGPAPNFISAKPCEFGIPQLLFVESCMGGRAEEFRVREKTGWDGEESAREMFELWRRLRKRCMGSTSVNEQNSRGTEERDQGLDEEQGEIINLCENQEVGGEENREYKNKEGDKEIHQDDKNKEGDRESHQDKNDSDNNQDKNKEETEENIEESSEKIVITPQKIPQCKPNNISPAFLDNIVWPEESPQKKNKIGKKQRERLPHSATSAKWLNYWERIEEEKKKKEEDKKIKKAAREEKKNLKTIKDNKLDQSAPSTSKKKQDWICPKCKGSYNMDVAMCNGRKWIGPCNDCDKWYHKNCVSKKLVTEFGLDDVSDNEESDFVCDVCFGTSDDELGVFDLDADDDE